MARLNKSYAKFIKIYTDNLNGAIAFLVYDFLQIMASAKWDINTSVKVANVAWKCTNIVLCIYITLWIVLKIIIIYLDKIKGQECER